MLWKVFFWNFDCLVCLLSKILHWFLISFILWILENFEWDFVQMELTWSEILLNFCFFSIKTLWKRRDDLISRRETCEKYNRSYTSIFIKYPKNIELKIPQNCHNNVIDCSIRPNLYNAPKSNYPQNCIMGNFHSFINKHN